MSRVKRFMSVVKVVLVLALFALALKSLHHELANYRWRDLVAYLNSLPRLRVVLAIVMAFAGYVVMTGYDAFALRYVDRALSYWRIALASFTGYAINNNIGLSGVVGTSLRYRFYRGWGLERGEIARVFVFCTVTYWLGFVLLGGSVFVLQPPAMPPKFHVPFASIQLLGVVLLIPGIAYFLWIVFRRQPLRIQQWELHLPTPSFFAVQVAISMADWVLAGAVLYILLPVTEPLSFVHVLGIFLLAQIGGLVSNVPGGLGVFEAIALLFLTPHLAPAQILGALVAFRGIYFLLPLVVALLLLATHEVMKRSLLKIDRGSSFTLL